jgi:hypothetical protein
MSPIVKGFGCRPHEGRRHEFGGRRPKPFTQAVIVSVSLCLSGSRSRTGLQLYESARSISDTCPAAVQPLTIGSEVYLTRSSS